MRTFTWLLPPCLLAPLAQAQNWTHPVTATVDDDTPEVLSPTCPTLTSDVIVNGSRVTNPLAWSTIQVCGPGALYNTTTLGLDGYLAAAGLAPADVQIDALTTAQDTFICDSLPNSGPREVEVEYTLAREGSGVSGLGYNQTDPLVWNQYALHGGDGAAGDTFVTRWRFGFEQDFFHASNHLGLTPGGLDPMGLPLPESSYNALADEVVPIYPVYFSLDATSAAALDMSGADVLCCPAPGAPAVIVLQWLDLGLNPGDDIDALSISRLVEPGEVELLFSLSKNSSMFGLQAPFGSLAPNIPYVPHPAVVLGGAISVVDTTERFLGSGSTSPLSLGPAGLARAHWGVGGSPTINRWATPDQLGLRWGNGVTDADDLTGAWVFDPLLGEWEVMGLLPSTSPTGATYDGMAEDYASLLANGTAAGRDRCLNLREHDLLGLDVVNKFPDAVGPIHWALVARMETSLFDAIPTPLFLDNTIQSYIDPYEKPSQDLRLVASSSAHWTTVFGPAYYNDSLGHSFPFKIEMPPILTPPGKRQVLQALFFYWDGTQVRGRVSNAIELYRHIQQGF